MSGCEHLWSEVVYSPVFIFVSLFSSLFAVRAMPPLIITLCCINDKTMVRNNTAYKLLHSVKTDTVLNGVKIVDVVSPAKCSYNYVTGADTFWR